MWTLGIESATPAGGVALLKDGAVKGEVSFERGMVHGRDLAPAIQKLCRDNHIAPTQLDLVAVDIGPGSYTGLRVGLACAKGLCFAAKKPIVGVVSLDALALQFARATRPPIRRTVCPALDAKWNQIYFGIYEILESGSTRTSGPSAEVPEKVAARLPRGALVFGDAVRAFPQAFKDVQVNDQETHFHPRARIIAELGAQQFAAGKSDNISSLEPLYLRPTEAELKFKK